MGLLGKLESFGKAVWDTGNEVVGDVASLVEGAGAIGDFIERVGKVTDLDDVIAVGGRFAGRAEKAGLNKFLRAANAPILDSGQLVIAGMKLTTGLGEPEDGERFGRGGARLHDADATLRSAEPTANWSGAGANSYSVQNVEQLARTRAMAAADHQVHGVLATEAFQVRLHRDRLDDWYNWLADVGLVTFALGLLPDVGQGLRAVADVQAVLVAVGRSSSELYQLSSEVGANAAALQQLVGRYENVGQTANLSQRGADQNPPPPPSAPHEQSPPDGPGDKDSEDTPTTPRSEQPPGNPGQFVAPTQTSGGPGSGGGSGSPAMGGPPPTPPVDLPAVQGQQTSAGGGRPSGPGTQPGPLGGMPPGAMSAGPAPMAAAPGVPVALIKEAVQAAMQREAERQAAEDEEDKDDEEDDDGDGKPDAEEDTDGDGKPDEKKDEPVAAPGGIDAGRAPVRIEMDVDVERLTTPITVTVDRENSIGPPPAPAP
ncbi:MAG: hypothetical protein QOF25_4163 [Mycobacterium sp.]|nr:hypothetical protein [Mycobacterium sp.]